MWMGSLQILQNYSSSDTADGSSLFLQPQQVSLHLRPAVSQSFPLTISTPTDQPITELTLETSEVPAGINITFSSVQRGSPLMMQVNVEAAGCPNTSDSVNQNQTGPWSIQITPRGFTVSLKLEITLQCRCSCTQHRQEKSPDCNGFGSLVCGRCYCEKNLAGSRCQLLSDEFLTRDERHCRRDETKPLCSGRGTCVEGTCQCNRRPNPAEGYSGAFCECSNFDCPYHNNSICGGNGRCECGKCICDPLWTGESCECSMDTTSCLAKNQQVCNGRGFCECGACRCTDPKFSGPTCEECPFCPGRCTALHNCVECWVSGLGPSRCASECGQYNVTMVATHDELYDPKKMPNLCKFWFKDLCSLFFAVPFPGQSTIPALLQCDQPDPASRFSFSFADV
uniref:Integrin beta n=1 Tax=Amphiprion ocellaris TaxID=80972 RepID=A0AAQ5WX85_AMPOC